MKPLYKYETHLHTTQGSACAISSGADYILPYINAGYSGIIVTDHFYGGNTCISRDLDWEQWVNLYCFGYEQALKTAQEINQKNNTINTDKEFKVFFGFEQTFRGDDYLIYGLDKNWLLQNPNIINFTHHELFSIVCQNNGLMIQAHPFRFRSYQKAIHLYPRNVHGVEVYNAGNLDAENEQAKLYAKIYDFPCTSGSDIHNVQDLITLPKRIGGMAFSKPLNSINDYCSLVKNKKGIIINNNE